MLPGSSTTEREMRRSRRAPVQLQSAVGRAGDKKVPAILTSISSTGCSLKGVVNLRVDEAVYVRIPGLEGQPAQIRWTLPGIIGLAFVHPLHPAVVERVCNL